MFSRSLILAGAFATALVPMSAAPARAADAVDIAKIVGSIAVLYAVGRAVSKARAEEADDDDEGDRVWHRNAQDDDRRAFDARRFRAEERQERLDRADREWRAEHGWGRALKRGAGPNQHGTRKHASQRNLPLACQRALPVRHKGKQIVMAQRCLARSGFAPRDLPQTCRVTVRGRGGPRPAYGSHCLQRSGYRIGR